ncbi:MAG: polysaccharide biosynthesis/export family protein [Puia sp.]|nr:polysaccharide biosynthesis/export family protein [Puia sp.]
MSHSSSLRAGSVFALAAIVFLSLFFTSCYTTKPYTYLQGPFDTAALSKIPVIDPIIRKGDVLSIVVYSDNPEATAMYNQSMPGTASVVGVTGPATGGSMGGGSQSANTNASGYTVDEKGNIEMQGIGLLHVEGLTRSGVKDSLDGRLKKFLLNPYYTIRFVNYFFTILGEVNSPGHVNLPSVRVNILEALGMVGDMTFYGRRDNVLVIRDNNGTREFGRMDLTKPEVMNSPFFYLQQNDIVIVEQSKKKISANDQTLYRNISITATIISIAVLLVTLFRK